MLRSDIARAISCIACKFGLFLLVALFWASPAALGAAGVLIDYKKEEPKENLQFSIVMPDDWEVVQNAGGFEIFAEPVTKNQPTAANPIVADPNISVLVSRNPMPIDEKSLESYSGQMLIGLQKSLGESSGVEIFLKRVVDINESRKGLLYYLRYKKGQFDVYNAVLIASSDTHLFRVTLTDYEVSFDANLELLFPFMSSINVGTKHMTRPSLLEVMTPWIGGALALVILLLGLNMVRLRLSRGQLSGALSESIHEQSVSKHPYSKPVEFKNADVSEDYDPEFREDSEESAYQRAEDYTEVPLSQAMGSGSGPFSSQASSVTDPETEVSQISSGYGAEPSRFEKHQKGAPPPPPRPRPPTQTVAHTSTQTSAQTPASRSLPPPPRSTAAASTVAPLSAKSAPPASAALTSGFGAEFTQGPPSSVAMSNPGSAAHSSQGQSSKPPRSRKDDDDEV